MVWGGDPVESTDDELAKRFDSTLVAPAFRILMVCTGNICRSPMAERMLLAALAKQSPGGDVSRARISVSSAGTIANEGSAMTREAQRETELYGGDGSDHLAHRLELGDIQAADLILAMSREHRRAVVSIDPRASSKVFTLTEFARLVDAPGILELPAPGERASDDPASKDLTALRSMVTTISESRGYLPPPTSDSEFDITDPYGRSARVYSRVGAAIGTATTTLAGALVRATQDP
jgi:protein-tyrosine phosphatase